MADQAENPDERVAREWLIREGYDDVQRLSDDPPDFVVNGNCAVEVTRLSQRIGGGAMKSKAEEEARKPLEDQIAKVIERLGAPGNEGRSWAIDCEYDFSRPPPDRVLAVPAPRLRLPKSVLDHPFIVGTGLEPAGTLQRL